LPRAHFELAGLALASGLHSDREFMHPAIVLFLLAKCKSQTIARGQVADDLSQAGAVVATERAVARS